MFRNETTEENASQAEGLAPTVPIVGGRDINTEKMSHMGINDESLLNDEDKTERVSIDRIILANGYEIQGLVPMNRIIITSSREISGSVYKIYSGKFGCVPGVIVKRASASHQSLVYNDKAKMQALYGTRCFQTPLHFELSADHIYLALQEYEMNFCEIITSEDKETFFKKFDQQQLVRGAFNAVAALHDYKLVHRDLRPKNFAICRETEEKWRTIVTGLKYCIREGTSTTASVDLPAPTHKILIPEMDSIKQHSSRHDKYQLACVLYMLLIWKHVESPTLELQFDFSNVKYKSFRDYQLQHLIKVLLAEFRHDSILNVPLRHYLDHPFFKTETELVYFEMYMWEYALVQPNMIEKQLKDEMKVAEIKIGANRLDEWLEAERALLFKNSWTELVPNELVKSLEIPESDKRQFMQLWNNRINRDDDYEAINHLMYRSRDEYFLLWEKLCPLFNLYLFWRLINFNDRGKRVFEMEELASFFPSGTDFYMLCSATSLIDPPDTGL